MRLQGKVALITGASRGIGAAIAETFVREGAEVLLTSRSDEGAVVAARLRTAGGPRVEFLAGDVADDAHARALIQFSRKEFRRLDILVNNAGIMTAGKLGMVRLDDVRRQFEINVFAALNLMQYALRAFPRETGGAVINLASIAGTQGVNGLAAYSASKAAVIGLTRAAAKELAPQKVRVNAVAPGFIETDLIKGFSPDVMAETVASIGLGRLGSAADVARCVAFLASDEASYLTGQVVGIDGGMVI